MNTGVSSTVLIVVAIVGGLGVVLGALITGVVNLRVEKVKERRERESWMRDKRFDAALDVCALATKQVWSVARSKEAFAETSQEFSRACVEATLASPNFAREIQILRDNLYSFCAAQVLGEEWNPGHARQAFDCVEAIERAMFRLVAQGRPELPERLTAVKSSEDA